MNTTTTLSYYNTHARDFYENTVNVDFSATQQRFLSKLPQGAYRLDFGCGSGRDSRFFIERGYQVDASDGSEEMCRLAGAYAGIEVKHMLFQELSEKERYDGIWACSSILHLPVGDLEAVLGKMADALKDHGVIYTSFKYGTFSGERNGRYFTDMTEETFERLIERIPQLGTEEQWMTSDVRPGRGEEKWLNLILRKRQA